MYCSGLKVPANVKLNNQMWLKTSQQFFIQYNIVMSSIDPNNITTTICTNNWDDWKETANKLFKRSDSYVCVWEIFIIIIIITLFGP